MSTQTAASATDREDVKEEFHDKPVPLRARLGFKEPVLVWSGFGIAYICAVIGGLIQQGLGTTNAILAILLGNFILFLYSAAIGIFAIFLTMAVVRTSSNTPGRT